MTAHSIGEEIFYATILGLPLLHVFFLLNNTSAEHFATVANSAATQSVML